MEIVTLISDFFAKNVDQHVGTKRPLTPRVVLVCWHLCWCNSKVSPFTINGHELIPSRRGFGNDPI